MVSLSGIPTSDARIFFGTARAALFIAGSERSQSALLNGVWGFYFLLCLQVRTRTSKCTRKSDFLILVSGTYNQV